MNFVHFFQLSLVLLAFSTSSFVSAAHAKKAFHAQHAASPSLRPLFELAIRTNYSPSAEPLGTEQIWKLDPEELNPHRQRWVLNRKVELTGLEPRESSSGVPGEHFGVRAEGLTVATLGSVRGDGPWYQPLTDFPCHKEPVSWFGTPEGARTAAASAAHSWEKALDEDKIKLAVLLSRVSATTKETALLKARLLFDVWLKSVESTWRVRGRQQAKLDEWKYYESEAATQGLCHKGASHAPVAWEKMMEPPGQGPLGLAGTPDETKLLARAPARRWDGLFSIHTSILIGGRKLNGRFLIDSGVGTSVLSPDFLEAQGILPAWIILPGAPPIKMPWGGGDANGGGGLAPRAGVDATFVGDFQVDLKDFAIFDTEFFSPPEAPGSCCDGVLGTDFLRKYVIELNPGPPAEVKLWPAANFHLAENSGTQWIESGLTPTGDLVSTCQAQLGDSKIHLVGARWDTGRDDALDIHLPWQSEARGAIGVKRPNSWEISCGPAASTVATTGAPAAPIARAVQASFPKMEPYENRAILEKVPAFSVGMALLGRARIFLDLPHGRIWFPAKTISADVRENRTGLELKYAFLKGNTDQRGLFVKAIRPGSQAAQALAKRGLKVGMMISRFDTQNPEDLDAWQVNQYLAGAYGEQVTMQWKTSGGLKLGALKVR
jgi:hypothetical protein